MSVNSLDKHGNSHQRRRLLCIFLLFVSPILLTACQVTQPTPTPTLSTTHTTTATSTATHTPTITPSPAPTETATITPTPTPLVIAKPWEISREDQDKTLAQLMFPFIGGINHINRHGIDLRYGDLNIAFVHDSQIDPAQDIQALRETYAGQLNQDPQLLDQLASIRAQLEGIANVTVVIEDGQITQVATKPYQTITRYVLENNGTLREMTAEEEPQLLPELVVDGPYIKRADTRETIYFKGGSIFVSDAGKNQIFNYIRGNIESNRRLGINPNLIRISYHTRDLTELSYDQILQSIRYLEQQGIYAIITPHNDQENQNNDNYFLPNENDIQSIEKIAEITNKCRNVIYGLWNEPANTNWNTWSGYVSIISSRILSKFQGTNYQPLILVSGIEWSRDFRNYKIPLENNSYIADVHEYPLSKTQTNIGYMYEGIVGKFPIIMTEIGGASENSLLQTSTDIERIKNIMSKIKENPNIAGFALWRFEDTGSNGDGVRTGNRLTPRGRALFEDITNNPPIYFTK